VAYIVVNKGRDMRKAISAAAVALVGALATIGFGVAPAGAAGPPVDKFDGIYLECDALGEIFIVSIPGDGHWVPGPILGTNTVLVPYRFHFEESFTPAGGTTETQVFDAVKRAPKNQTLDRCSGEGTFSDDAGTYTTRITAWVAVH
jgi:hypothetical protein